MIMYAVAFTLITLCSTFFFNKYRRINPVFMFLIFNWISGVGVILNLDLSQDADYSHLWIVLFTPIFFILGAVLFSVFSSYRSRYDAYWSSPVLYETSRVNLLAFFLFIVSAFMSYLYYYLVGFNLLSLSLSGGADDFTTMRLSSYSGEDYFAPGYFNQFKNTLLPVLAFYFIMLSRLNYRKYFLLTLLLIGGFLLYSILGTGQRTFLVFSLILLLFFLVGIDIKPLTPLRALVGGGLLMLIFGFYSVQLGRIQDGGILVVFQQFFSRIFYENQIGSVIGFRYIYTIDIQWGSEWLESFMGLLPGNKGSDIANVIHDIMFGSMRGTAPLSVWGSVYYNFGFFGSFFLALLIGYLYAAVYYVFISGPRAMLRIAGFSSIFVYLSIWVASGPVQLLNNGLLTVIILLILRRISLAKWRSA